MQNKNDINNEAAIPLKKDFLFTAILLSFSIFLIQTKCITEPITPLYFLLNSNFTISEIFHIYPIHSR